MFLGKSVIGNKSWKVKVSLAISWVKLCLGPR